MRADVPFELRSFLLGQDDRLLEVRMSDARDS